MRKVRRYSIFVLIGVFGFLSSCFNSSKDAFEFFMVKVDSLNIPASISHKDTLHIRLYGTIGTDGCYSFSHFEAERDSFELRLAVWGKHDTKAIACPAVMVYLDTVYSLFPLYPGLFSIYIQQPDNSILRDSVIIQ